MMRNLDSKGVGLRGESFAARPRVRWRNAACKFRRAVSMKITIEDKKRHHCGGDCFPMRGRSSAADIGSLLTISFGSIQAADVGRPSRSMLPKTGAGSKKLPKLRSCKPPLRAASRALGRFPHPRLWGHWGGGLWGHGRSLMSTGPGR